MNSLNHKERRQHERFPFNGEIKIGGKIRVEPFDISESGLYIITKRSLILGSEFEVFLTFKDKESKFKTRVQNMQEGIGMGLMFINNSVEMEVKIRNIIEDIKINISKSPLKKHR
ncbi:MAG: PilZ domain-containing protein [Candidatus Hodarchaeales archaeon]|jgi:hypothetical protein